MNKTQLVVAVADQAGISRVDARKALDAFVQVTGQALREGDKIALTGFGAFSTARRSERMGRNPRTGAAVRIAAKNTIRFRPGVELSELVQ